MKKTLALLLAVLMLAALFAGCGKKDEKPAATDNGDKGSSTITTNENNEGASLVTIDSEKVHPSADATIKVAGQAAPTAMSVLGNTSAAASMGVTQLFYDTLTTYDSVTGEVLPCLATSWEWLDSRTIRFKLREDVYSQLGDPFTASDVVYSLQWGCDTPKLKSTHGAFFDMENTKAVDDYTVDIALVTDNPYMLMEFARSYYQFAVEASVEKLGGKEATAKDPSCGTGPYKLVKWDETNNVIYAERNEDYWGTLPYYKNYEYYIVVDSTARGMGVEAGDYDVCISPTSNSVIAAKDNKALSAYFTPGTAMIRWDINSDREPFNIKEVRQALALAVNYDAIAQVSYSGYASKIDSPYSVNTAWHSAPAEGETEFYYTYDMERAKAKLVEAGYADGFDMHIMIVSGRSYISNACEIINNNLKELNINVTIDQYESATYGSFFNAFDYDSVINTAVCATPMNYLKCCDPRFIGGGCTAGSAWCKDIESDFYAVVDACKTTTDLDAAYGKLAEFQDIVREYCPFIPICNPNTFDMTSKDIVNVAWDSSGSPIYTSFYEADYIA